MNRMLPSIFKGLFASSVDSYRKAQVEIIDILKKHSMDALEKYNVKKETKMCKDKEHNNTLFDELYQQIENDNCKNNCTTNMNINVLYSDFHAMIAGAIDTTSHALETAIVYLSKFEQLQEEIFNEIHKFQQRDINGNSNSNKYFVILDDILKCVKFRAFVHEMIRISAGLPIGVARSLVKNCILSFNGMLSNLYTAGTSSHLCLIFAIVFVCLYLF